MLQESWFSRWTFYRYSRSIPQRSSLSWITTRNRMDRSEVQRVGRTCTRRPHVLAPLQRKREDTKDNGISPWTNQAKMGLWNFDPIFELLSLWKTVYTTSQANKLKSLFLQNNTVYGIPLQAHRGGTRIGNKFIRFFFKSDFFATIGFAYSRWRSTVTDGGCRQIHFTRHFLMQFAHLITCISHCMAQDEPPNVSVLRISFHLHVIHDVCLSVRWLFLVCLFLFVFLLFLSVVYLFSSTLYLHSARHSICNVDTAEGWNPLHSRTKRSIAPWRNTILSQMKELELLLMCHHPRPPPERPPIALRDGVKRWSSQQLSTARPKSANFARALRCNQVSLLLREYSERKLGRWT